MKTRIAAIITVVLAIAIMSGCNAIIVTLPGTYIRVMVGGSVGDSYATATPHAAGKKWEPIAP